MFSRIYKKFVPLLLIVSLAIPSGLLLYPQKTEAAGATCLSQITGALGVNKIMSSFLRPVPTADNTTQLTTGGSFVTDCILKPLAIQMARAMLQNITSGVVRWINNGFKSDGNPIFVQDLRGLMRDTADQVIGGFIANDLGAGFLCNSFSLQVRVALAQSYMPYRQRSACTLSQISGNVSGFVENNNGGGWDRWLETTTIPQNNVYGATVLAQDELSKRIFDAQSIKKDYLDWGKGFRSWRVCTAAYDSDGAQLSDPETLDADDPRCDNSETRTPGGVVESQLTASLGSDMRRLEVAQDIDAIVGALTNQLMSQVVSGAQGLLGVGRSSNTTRTSTYQTALNAATADQDLNNAINAGLTYSTNEANALFTQGQPVVVSEAPTTDPTDDDTPAPAPEPPRVAWEVIKNSSPVTGASPLNYEVALTSNYSTSSITVVVALLRKSGGQARFSDLFFNPQFTAGRTDTSQSVSYIQDNNQATMRFERASASKNVNFVIALLAYKKGNAPSGTYVLETTATDAQGRVITKTSSDFVVQ